MTVSPLLAALATYQEDVDPTVLATVWTLAERSADMELMRDILARPNPLPASVLAAARARKEVAIRVAYLLRRDLADGERSELLENEKRADVFAGLIDTAKKDEKLAERLYAQLTDRPTKTLARVMLRENFQHKDSVWLCVKLVAKDKTHVQALDSRLRNFVSNVSDPDKVEELIGLLPDRFLVLLPDAAMTSQNKVEFVERLGLISLRDVPRYDWEERNVVVTAGNRLVELAANATLPMEAVTYLDGLSGDPRCPVSTEIASVLAARIAGAMHGDDEDFAMARNATGYDITKLIKLAESGNVNQVGSIVQGLLQNAQARNHDQFRRVVEIAKPAFLIRAIGDTKDVELFKMLWSYSDADLPVECLGFFEDRDAVMHELLRHEVSGAKQEGHAFYGYRVSHGLSKLLEWGVPDAAVADIPYRLIAGSSYNRWASRQVIDLIGKQLERIQLETLGSDVAVWESFNNLASDWSGTFGELVTAAASL